MDPRLLPGADADRLPVHRVADRIGLRVFQRDERNDEIADRGFRQILVFRDDVLEERRVDFAVVSLLLEGHAKHLLPLERLRNVGGIDLDHVVRAVPLRFQNLKSAVRIARRDDAVRNLAFDEFRRRHVANVRQCHEIPERTHPVRAARSRVCTGERRFIQPFDAVNEASSF